MTKRNLGFWHFAAEHACPLSRRVLEGKRTISQVLRPLRGRRPAPASTSISMAPSALGGPSLAAFEHLRGDERGRHRRWPAGVANQMGNALAQLALFEPVVERTLQVADQLLLAAERYQGGTRDQAAVALGQTGAPPYFPEQHPFAERRGPGRCRGLDHALMRVAV